MKKILLTTAVLALAAGAFAAERNVTVGNFSGINASGNIEIEYRVGSPSLRLVGDSREIAAVDVRLMGQMLNIDAPVAGEVKAYLYGPVSNTFILNSLAELDVESDLDLGNRTFSVRAGDKSSADFRNVSCGPATFSVSVMAEVEVDRLVSRSFNANVLGTAELSVGALDTNAASATVADIAKLKIKGGTVRSINFNASGSSVVKASRLAAGSGQAIARGSSLIEVNVSGKFTSRSTDSASVSNINK